MLSIKIDQASNTANDLYNKEGEKRFSHEMGNLTDFDTIHKDPGNNQINVAAGVGILSSTGAELSNFDAFYAMYRQAVSPSNKALSKEKFKEAIIREAQKITQPGEKRKLGFITKDIGKTLSKKKWKEYETTAKKILKDRGIDWEPLPQQIKRALLHMNYVFSKGLRGFPTALRHLANEDYKQFWQHALTRDDGSDLLLDAPDAQGNPVQGKGFGKKDFDYFKELRDDHLNPPDLTPAQPMEGINEDEQSASVEDIYTSSQGGGLLGRTMEALIPSAVAQEGGRDPYPGPTPYSGMPTQAPFERGPGVSNYDQPQGTPRFQHEDVGTFWPQSKYTQVQPQPQLFPQESSADKWRRHIPEGMLNRPPDPFQFGNAPGPSPQENMARSVAAPSWGLGNNTADEQAAEGYLHTIPTEDNRYSPREWMAGEIESEPMDIGSGVPTKVAKAKENMTKVVDDIKKDNPEISNILDLGMELLFSGGYDNRNKKEGEDFWESMKRQSNGAAMWR